MSVLEGDVRAVCINHPRRDTVVRCGKCGDPICTQCMIQTPVGMRCRRCAGLRKLPQYQIGAARLALAAAGGLVTSAIAWFLLSGVAFLGYILFFVSMFVGIAVGEVMSRLAKRRDNIILEVTAVLCTLVGRAAVLAVQTHGDVVGLVTAANGSPMVLLSLVVPVAIASWLAVLKLR